MSGILFSLAIALCYLLGYRFPAASGHGYLEAAGAFLLPAAVAAALARGRRLGWIYLGMLLGLAAIFYWVPEVMHSKGPLPYAVAIPAGLAFYAYEAAGFLLVAALARAALRRGPVAAALAAALAMVAWETFAFHIYDLSTGAALGGVPWMAKGAAFVGTHGLAALLWGLGTWTGIQMARHAGWRKVLAGPALCFGLLGLAAGLWRLLPRGQRHDLDVVTIQPNFPAGERWYGMEEEMWRRTDAELRRAGLPRPGCATLVLWPESAVLGRDDRGPSPRLRAEAQRRGIALLFGTEGGRLNLIRGEADGQPSFIQAKVLPMPFGERMPGPAWLRGFLDRQMGFWSQEPGQLGPGSSFRFATPQGPLVVHPLICSEALVQGRVTGGVAAAGADLLTNHTNDGWFDRSQATDLHAAQIRLRPVEAGLPMVRATLTGKSGVFREDGSWVLWGEPMTEAAASFHLTWTPIATPARHPGTTPGVLVLLGLSLVLAGLRKK